MTRFDGKAVKCTICGHLTVNPARAHAQIVDIMQKYVNEELLVQSGVDPCDWECCELCWYGMIYNWHEYVWDGVNLMVFNRKEGEFIEYHGNVWKPIAPGNIQFEKDENGKWEVKAA